MSFEMLDPLALAASLAWAAGLRVYGTVFLVGMLAQLGWVDLSGNLDTLGEPWIIALSGVLFALEFFADKVPLIDSVWDGFNTFVRVPGGALLAALALGDSSGVAMTAAALLGGTLAGGTHLAKAGARAAINTSPEPVSNWLASFTEDGVALGLPVLALTSPWLLLGALAIFLLLLIWLLPKLIGFAWRVLRRLWASEARGRA
jgi:hypothetical protein